MARNERHLGARFLIAVGAPFAVVFFFGCPRVPVTPEPEMLDAGADVIVIDDRPACVRACGRLVELGCKEGEPTPSGQSCEVWFCDAVEAGIVDLKPECLATIASCDQVDTVCR